LTLSLRITGARPDGYHLLDAEMVTVDLADTLYFSAGEGLEVVEVGPGGTGDDGYDRGPAAGREHGPPPRPDDHVPAAGYDQVPVDGSNLVSRALALVGRQAHVRLVKRIPAGAGLGGGSADAAAVLRWAGATGPTGLGLAIKLGSDVPFCLAGEGRARVSGSGEVLEPLPFEQLAGAAFTLLVPPFGVSTAAVYGAWDELGGPEAGDSNDLEPAALRVEPRLATWRDRLGEATGQQPQLAGSGSTWFVRGDYPGDGRLVVRVARDRDVRNSA